MNRGKSDEGYVLVAVLGVMLVLAGLIAASSLVAQSALRGARTDIAIDRLDAILRGGLEITAFRLFTQKLAPATVSGRDLRFESGIVTPQISDEAARIDVNGADPELLAGALRAVGLESQAASAIAARVAARRGKPEAASGGVPAGSAAEPARMQPAAGANTRLPSSDAKSAPTRTGFRSVAEFLTFAELDKDDRAALSDLLTVMNPDGKLNVLSAGRRALLALPQMSEATVDAVLAERRSVLRSGLGSLKSLLDRQKNHIKFEPGPCFRVHLASRDGLGRSAARDAVIAAGNDQADPFYILEWN